MLPVYAAGAIDVPYAVDGMDERVTHDTAWPAHAHPTHELLWNHRGSSVVTVGHRSWTITPRFGVWLPAGTVHTGFAAAGTWYRAAQFSVTSAPPLSEGPTSVAVTDLLRLLLQRLRDPELTTPSRRLAEAMVIDVLEPSEHDLVTFTPTSPLLAPLVATLEADPGDPRGLSAWADSLGVSPRTITRTLQAETGVGFQAWVAGIRCQRAIALLTDGHDLLDVATAVGYRSISAFGVAFRRTIGLTPGTFRTT